jgi:amino acid exporter
MVIASTFHQQAEANQPMGQYVNAIVSVVVLFLLGLASPGPNFLVVVQTTLRSGRLAGFITGLGAATGDTVYATAGLFGVQELIARGGQIMTAIRLGGGLYLVWIGVQMLWGPANLNMTGNAVGLRHSAMRDYIRGLATDLSNPKTILFFASIFTLVVHPGTPAAVRLAILIAVVATSVSWRSFLAVVFSTLPARELYERAHVYVERVFGVTLCLFGLRLVARVNQS